jgi:hypothetical protein
MKISSIAETIILPNLIGQRKPRQKYIGFELHRRKKIVLSAIKQNQ